MNIVFGVIIGFLILMALVVAHEFGHFIVARKNGVEVEEFGIGFPPRAIAWIKNPEYLKWKEQQAALKKSAKEAKNSTQKTTQESTKKAAPTRPKKWLRLPRSEWGKKQKTLIFSLNYLPIGGFCSMKGESDSDTRPHSFGSASLWSKTKILFAGVAMNWLAAFVILTILNWTGMPVFMDNQFIMPNDTTLSSSEVVVKSVIEKSPAEEAGFLAGDIIKSAHTGNENVNFESATEIIEFNTTHAGGDVIYTVIRQTDKEANQADNQTGQANDKTSQADGEHLLKVTLNSEESEYLLGITMGQDGQALYHSTWSAPIVAAVNTVQLTGETYRGLWSMLKSFFTGISKQFSTEDSIRSEGQAEIKAAGDSISGPVGIIGVLFPNSVAAGPTTLAFLAAVISVSLACMNVLPIPALDGGRFCLIALFRLRGKNSLKKLKKKSYHAPLSSC